MGSNPTLSVGMVLNGEVLEWPNRRDWKSRVPQNGTVGSNPTLSATLYIKYKPQLSLTEYYVFSSI